MAQQPSKTPSKDTLALLGQALKSKFTRFESDRRVAEQRWLRNLRQYLGVYDPEIERQLDPMRSKAYPRITRVKCISVLSRLMNLMFPGNERNWALNPSPAPDLPAESVRAAFQQFLQKQQDAGVEIEPSEEDLQQVIYDMAKKQADKLSMVIDDYLQELGGDQTYDYIALNRQVVMSGILYGVGVLLGPFARQEQEMRWEFDEYGTPQRQARDVYKPQFEPVAVWDFYPDMTAKSLRTDDGYFIRRVMSKQQVKGLAGRQGFFEKELLDYLSGAGAEGNYRERTVDTELKSMGLKQNVDTNKTTTGRYEVLTWYGPVAVSDLKKGKAFGLDTVADLKDDDEVQAEIWMTGDMVIGMLVAPWRQLGANIRTCHTFVFDEDDTSVLGNGLPYVMRDSQMAVCAASRMLLDNASVVCGPNLELNLDLLRPDQDLTNIQAYKRWYREGTGADANVQAVRNVAIDSHISELKAVIDLFMEFADAETFVGPATGGDMARGPSEPMRSAAGASMLRGEAALPFKDIVRNFDSFTQSVIYALVAFSRQLGQHPDIQGDYDVVARGATSLLSKEVRGIQLDQMAQTLTPMEQEHVDPRKMVTARFAVRDLTDMLLSETDVKMRQAAQQQAQAEQADMQNKLIQATIRDILASAFKDIAQGQKSIAMTEKTRVDAVGATLGMIGGMDAGAAGIEGSAGDGAGAPGDTGDQGGLDMAQFAGAGGNGAVNPMPA